MKKNMGSTDRLIRMTLALVFAALFLTEVVTGIMGWVLLAVSIIFLLTSFISFCPLYTVLGINTCKNKVKA